MSLEYPSDKSLCALRMIKLYLEKTSSLRNRDIYSFFISYAVLSLLQGLPPSELASSIANLYRLITLI